jgi:hypothetical protein
MNDLWAVALTTTSLMTKCLGISAIVNAIFAAPAKIGALLATREYRAMIEASSTAAAKMDAYGTVGTKQLLSNNQTVGSGLIWVASASGTVGIYDAAAYTELRIYLSGMEYSPAVGEVAAGGRQANSGYSSLTITGAPHKFANNAAGYFSAVNSQGDNVNVTYRTW